MSLIRLGLGIVAIGILLAIFTTPYAGVVVLLGAIILIWGLIVGGTRV